MTFDAFLMPHVAELVEHIGTVHYITMLNLSKGYWQIPVTHQDHTKITYGTPWSLFEFV